MNTLTAAVDVFHAYLDTRAVVLDKHPGMQALLEDGDLLPALSRAAAGLEDPDTAEYLLKVAHQLEHAMRMLLSDCCRGQAMRDLVADGFSLREAALAAQLT